MHDQLINDLQTLRDRIDVDQKLLDIFINRVQSGKPLTRDQGEKDHFCNFYLPIHTEKKLVYLVVHKKSGLWMPPGGHLDIDETILECVHRECREELNTELNSEKITLFNISTTPINNPLQPLCNLHYDMWHTIEMNHTEFAYNQKESLDGGWFNLKEALEKITFPRFVAVLKKFSFGT